MHESLATFAGLAFVSLFTMVNPLGAIPVYVAMTASLPPAMARKVARKASLTAFLILAAFALTGQWLFRFFGIDADAMRVAGGVIFFFMGYEMLQARLTRTKYDDEEPHEYAADIAVTPLGIPIIAGPGAIASSIILMNQASSPLAGAIVLGEIALVIALTWLGLIGSKPVTKALGENGNRIMLRLMGLIVMVIAVEFFFSGLKPIVRDILGIPG